MARPQPDARRFEARHGGHLRPHSDAVRAAALLDRQELLIEQVRFMSEASYRRRQEIDLELCDIRRELGRLGFQSRA
jgi:hypothetical protein